MELVYNCPAYCLERFVGHGAGTVGSSADSQMLWLRRQLRVQGNQGGWDPREDTAVHGDSRGLQSLLQW